MKEGKSQKNFKISIRAKILTGMIACVLIVTNLIGWFFIVQAKDTLLEQCKKNARNSAKIAAERIDGDISLCKEIIKIDHHIVVDSYGNLNLEDSTASSCSQIVALFLKNKRVKLSSFGAAALYMGIIGDTNRFMYSATDERTFEAAMYLYNYDFDMQALYERMYMKHVKDLKVNAFILNHYIEDEGVAYYVLKDEDLKHLNISRERGSDFVNLLSSVDEYKVWLAITENTKDHNWRVSMRSRHIPVNEIANKYRGGGHAFASGATLLSLDELPLLLNDIKERINE